MIEPKKYIREFDGYGFGPRAHPLDQVIAAELKHTRIEGVAERAEANSETVGVALGRLVATLHRKGLLTLEEVSEIAGANIFEVELDGVVGKVPEPSKPREKRRPRQPSTWEFDKEGKLKK